MRYFLVFIVASLLLAGCEANHKAAVGQSSDSTSAQQTPESYNYQNTVLSSDFIDSTEHVFSDTFLKDKFFAFIPHGNINATKATIVILSNAGDTLFADSMPTVYLINHYELETSAINDDNAMEAYVVKTAERILSDSSFHSASEIQEILKDLTKEDFEDYDAYLGTCSENRYFFLLSYLEEDTRYLCYSLNKKRAISVFSCC